MRRIGLLLCQFAQSNAFVVADRVGFDEAALGLVPFLELHVDIAESDDEARVVGSQQVGLFVVVESVREELEYLVGLTEAVPGTVVFRIELFCI